MKKLYITPQTEIIRLITENFIADSYNKFDTTTTEQWSQHKDESDWGSIWDNMDDEE